MWAKGKGFGTFWIEKPWLMVGSYPAGNEKTTRDQKLSKIIESGIRCFINFTQKEELQWRKEHGEPELTPYEPYARDIAKALDQDLIIYNFPIPDYEPPSEKQMNQILEKLRYNENHLIPTYLHCWGGKGRTGTVLGVWLKEERGYSGQEVIDLYNRKKNDTATGPWDDPYYTGPFPDSNIQYEFILNW